MKIELKNIKHSEFASQETNCYQATIYINGKKVGTVENGGYGGCDNVHPYEVANQIDEYAKTLPKIVCDWIDRETGKPAEMTQTHETIFSDILNYWLVSKDLKRIMSKRIVYQKGDDKAIYQTRTMSPAEKEKLLANEDYTKERKIFNLMPFDQAVQLFKASANI